MKAFFNSFTTKQKVWLVISVALYVGGLTLIILDFIGNVIGVTPSRNEILFASKNFGFALFNNEALGFLFVGIIALILGAVIIAIVLSISSKNEDRAKEKQARREQRLKQMMSNTQSDKESLPEQK